MLETLCPSVDKANLALALPIQDPSSETLDCVNNLPQKIIYIYVCHVFLPPGFPYVSLQSGLDLVVGKERDVAGMSDGQDLPVPKETRPGLEQSERRGSFYSLHVSCFTCNF